jgi:hypothetical protein
MILNESGIGPYETMVPNATNIDRIVNRNTQIAAINNVPRDFKKMLETLIKTI